MKAMCLVGLLCLVIFASGQNKVLITTRHHASKMMANYVLEEISISTTLEFTLCKCYGSSCIQRCRQNFRAGSGIFNYGLFKN
jgi:hypothetical protein